MILERLLLAEFMWQFFLSCCLRRRRLPWESTCLPELWCLTPPGNTTVYEPEIFTQVHVYVSIIHVVCIDGTTVYCITIIELVSPQVWYNCILYHYRTGTVSPQAWYNCILYHYRTWLITSSDMGAQIWYNCIVPL